MKNNLKNCRLKALISTQKELSEKSGISRTVICAIENGRASLSAGNALILMKILNCRLDDLYGVIDEERIGKQR